MGVVLGDNRYGKAETRLVHVDRGAEAHRITDLNVTTTLAGELDATHLTGDNTGVLPTDTQKNTVYAFARDGVGEPEDFALRLARHFVDTQPTIHLARVHVESYRWEPVAATGHSFARGAGTRTATATYDGGKAWVVSGISDLTVLNTTGSQFRGFVRDRYTTLADADDRILATAVTARWRHESAGRLDRVARAGRGAPGRRLRRHAVEIVAADAVRHGPPGARAWAGARRGAADAAEQAPLSG
jgi:urate oxidase